MTDAERWQQAKNLFFDALAQAPADRVAFLNATCEQDPDLRARVQSLLAADEDGQSGPLDAPLLETSPSTCAHPDLGNQIGPYRIERLLGRGGMGNVYLAERADGAFQQQVALKLIRLGLDTEDILSRFRYERQILASLDHPNIATLHDGGVTDDGRPYFVMEYVEGEPITDYCDRNRLSTRHRLALFRTVCRAVEHAHRNLVVHRDLKPSNILVTIDGTAKLLDFGIAKLIADEGATSLTHTGERVMTPEYASPEQVRGEAITTGTDVYQLGVLLYELLTGQRPYQIERRVRWAIEQAILATEPTRPSTAVRNTTATTRVDAQTISTARATRPADLARLLSGDLDTICLTALQKSPERRYASAEHLGEDVRRHLAGLPVTARADSAVYRVGKFVRRHRGGVAASLLIFLVLLVGSVLYTVRIRAERDRTARALRQSEEALSFLQNMILAGDPIDGDPETPIGAVLDSAAARVDVDLRDEPEVARTIHAALGQVYLSLDRAEPAEHHLRKALALQHVAPPDQNVAMNLSNLATLVASAGRYEEAEGYLQQAITVLESLDNVAVALASVHDTYGYVLHESGREDQAITMHGEAVRLYREQDHPDVTIALNNLAIAYFNTGSPERAIETQRQVVETFQQQQAPPVRTAIALGVLAGMYNEQPDSAAAILTRSVALLHHELGEHHIETITTRVSLALQHYRNGALNAALRVARPALEDARRELGPDHPITAYAQEVTGAILCEADEPSTGAILVRRSLDTRSTLLPEGHRLLAGGMNLLGSCLAKAGQIVEAEPLLREGYEQLLKDQGPDNAATLRARERLRWFYVTTGRTEAAAQLNSEG